MADAPLKPLMHGVAQPPQQRYDAGLVVGDAGMRVEVTQHRDFCQCDQLTRIAKLAFLGLLGADVARPGRLARLDVKAELLPV